LAQNITAWFSYLKAGIMKKDRCVLGVKTACHAIIEADDCRIGKLPRFLVEKVLVIKFSFKQSEYIFPCLQIAFIVVWHSTNFFRMYQNITLHFLMAGVAKCMT